MDSAKKTVMTMPAPNASMVSDAGKVMGPNFGTNGKSSMIQASVNSGSRPNASQIMIETSSPSDQRTLGRVNGIKYLK